MHARDKDTTYIFSRVHCQGCPCLVIGLGGAFLTAGLPGTDSPTGPSGWVKCLRPRVSSHAPNEGVPRLGCAPEDNVPGMVIKDGDRPSRAPAWPLAPLAPKRLPPLSLPTTPRWCPPPPGLCAPRQGRTHILRILPAAPKAGNDYWVNTGMNERVGQSRTRQVGYSFRLSPPSQIQHDWQIPVGSDGIFSAGPRPVPGTEQEVTD